MSLDPKKTYLPDESGTPVPGVIEDWYNKREVVVYKLTMVSDTVINQWAEYVIEVLKAWPKDKPYLAVHDLSQAGISLQYAAMVNFDMMNIGITIAGRNLAEALFDAHPNWLGRVAVNFNLSLSGQTNRTLMSFLDRDHPSIQYKTFYNRTKCLRWLTTGITDTSEMRAVEDTPETTQTDTALDDKEDE